MAERLNVATTKDGFPVKIGSIETNHLGVVQLTFDYQGKREIKEFWIRESWKRELVQIFLWGFAFAGCKQDIFDITVADLERMTGVEVVNSCIRS